MKLFIKLMLALLVIALLLPFTILKNDDGKPLMSFSGFSLPEISLPDLPKLPGASDITPSFDAGFDGKDTFYKWYDADGNVQFTTEPPPEGIEYIEKSFDPNTNVIQAVKPLPIETAPESASTTTGKSLQVDKVGNAYSRESIEKLFEDAKNLENKLIQRLQRQDSATNQ